MLRSGALSEWAGGCRTHLRLRHSSPFPAHSLIALGPHSAKRSHAIPDGLNLFRARKSAYMLSGMMLSSPALSVIPGLTGYLVLCVMYRWSILLGNGSYDLFPGRLIIIMK